MKKRTSQQTQTRLRPHQLQRLNQKPEQLQKLAHLTTKMDNNRTIVLNGHHVKVSVYCRLFFFLCSGFVHTTTHLSIFECICECVCMYLAYSVHNLYLYWVCARISFKYFAAIYAQCIKHIDLHQRFIANGMFFFLNMNLNLFQIARQG